LKFLKLRKLINFKRPTGKQAKTTTPIEWVGRPSPPLRVGPAPDGQSRRRGLVFARIGKVVGLFRFQSIVRDRLFFFLIFKLNFKKW
jgi:hypothetical protein